MSHQEAVRIFAPAKVNLLLEVVRRREDGYHDIRSVMCAVGLCDALEVSISSLKGINLEITGSDLSPGPSNLAYKSASAFMTHFNMPNGISIKLNKKIPIAGGLGGGSSNAAAVLRAMAILTKVSDENELLSIASKLGADVPFFLFGPSAIAQGIGDRLTPFFVKPGIPILIANPRISISTKDVYLGLDMALTTGFNGATLPRFLGSAEDVASILRNDLETFVLRRYPQVANLKENLKKAGAINSLMSGSGASVFGIFSNGNRAMEVANDIREEGGVFAEACATVGPEFPGPWYRSSDKH